jgi:hypothetical protein
MALATMRLYRTIENLRFGSREEFADPNAVISVGAHESKGGPCSVSLEISLKRLTLRTVNVMSSPRPLFG